MTPQQHPKLAHLSDERLESLIERYYTGAKTADLVSEFNIDARPSELFKLFSPRVLPASLCPYCDVNLWQKLPSKSFHVGPNPYCPVCGHEHTDGTYRQCRCRNCLQQAADIDAAIKETKRHLVRQAYPPAAVWPHPDVNHLAAQLTLRDAVFVAALYRNAHVDDLATLGPPYANERPIAPTTELAKEILAHLSRRRLIRVSDTSSVDAFEFNAELTQVSGYYIFKVRYRIFPMLPIDMVNGAIRTIDRMANHGFWLECPETAANDA